MNFSNYSILDIIVIFSAIVIFIFFTYAAIISLIEKEKKAATSFILLGIITPLPFLFTGIIEFHNSALVSIILMSLLAMILLVYVLPVKVGGKIVDVFPKGRIDERNTMFSRNELQKDSENYKEYYSNNPDKLLVDEKFRSNPGLLTEGSSNYDRVMFSSADASFFAVDAFKSKVDGKVSSNRAMYDSEKISKYIKNWAKKLGAIDVGITELKDYHKYSYRGRNGNYGNKVELSHKFAIAFTVEMDYEALKTGPHAPAVMESAQQYLAAGAIAIQLAEFIRQLGYPAKAHIDGNYEVVCPLVAKDAGLGEIGRMGLLMTPKLGPRVRIAVVTTDIPLVVDKRKFDPTITDFCNNCKKCADVCPSNAISFDNRKNIDGVNRWQINQEACFNFWTITGTDCGKCVSTCPYSHPDNFLHNIIRFGIGNSAIFSRLALSLDNVIYGNKPLSKDPVSWMKMK
jgi:ferredoxin